MVPHVSQFLPFELCINTGKLEIRQISGPNSVQEFVKRLPGGLLGKDLRVNLEAQSAQRESYTHTLGTQVWLQGALLGRIRKQLSYKPEGLPWSHHRRLSRLQVGQRPGEGQARDSGGLRARKANVRVNTPGKGATRSFPSCTRSDHKVHPPQTSVMWASRDLEMRRVHGNSHFPFPGEGHSIVTPHHHQEIHLSVICYLTNMYISFIICQKLFQELYKC